MNRPDSLPASTTTRLSPEGALEHFFAEEVEGYLRIIAAFPPNTPYSEIRTMDQLLRAALRELRTLQHARLGRRGPASLLPAV